MVAMVPESYSFMQSNLTDAEELNLTAGMVSFLDKLKKELL